MPAADVETCALYRVKARVFEGIEEAYGRSLNGCEGSRKSHMKRKKQENEG